MSRMSDNETCPKCGWVVSYSREIWVRENSMYDSSIIEEDKK